MQLACGSGDRTIKLWDLATGTLKQTLEGHSSSVQSVAFSPDGRLLASGSGDQTIKLWNLATGALELTLEGHLSSVQSIAFSPDGRLLASGSDDQTIKLWDSATGTFRHTLSTDGMVSNVESSEKLTRLTTNLGSLNIQNWFESFLSDSSQMKTKVSLQTDRWIAIQGQKELWLPPNCRPACVTVKDATIALGCTNGRVRIITFII